MQKLIKKRVNYLRNQHYQNQAANFHDATIRRDIEAAYTIAKSHKTMAKKVPKPIKCPGLLDQFKNHFNPDFSTKPTPLQLQFPPPKSKLDPKK